MTSLKRLNKLIVKITREDLEINVRNIKFNCMVLLCHIILMRYVFRHTWCLMKRSDARITMDGQDIMDGSRHYYIISTTCTLNTSFQRHTLNG